MYPLSNVDCLVDGMACLSTCLTLYGGVYVSGGWKNLRRMKSALCSRVWNGVVSHSHIHGMLERVMLHFR